MEFKTYIKTHYEIVTAAQIEQPIETQINPNFKATKVFPIGSYLIQLKNGQQALIEAEEFHRFYNEVKDAVII